MSLEDIPGKAKIIGSLTYDAGQAYMNGEYVQQIKPAAQKVVYVRVSNASLSPTGLAAGFTVYETTTDESGSFSIEIPAIDIGNGVSVEIQPETFIDVYSEYEGMVNGSPKFKQEEVVYEIEAVQRSLKTSDIEVVNRHYNRVNSSDVKTFDYTSYFDVKVGIPVSEKVKDDYGDYHVVYKYDRAQDVNVTIKVQYDNSTTKTYGATTSNGVAQFAIPAYEKDWNANITISVEPFSTNNFHYYYTSYGYSDEPELEVLSGIYKASSINRSYSFNPLQRTTAEVKMTFDPDDDQEYEDYNEYKWNGEEIEF